MILKGKKVILRPLSTEDVARFCKWLDDTEVTKFLSVYEMPKPSLKEEKDWIEKIKKSKKDIVLSIDTIDGVHIGSTGLHKIIQKQNAEFGVMIGDKKYWGQGCGTEVCRLMVDYGFKKLKLHRIYLRHIAYNIRGEKAYKKVGFKIEGRMREHILRDNAWHDEIYMGLLRDEYLKNNKK